MQSENKKTINRQIPFWSENPNILIDKTYFTEWFPLTEMSYNQKLNAITRLVLLFAILLFVCNQHLRILPITLLTLAAIFFVHYHHSLKSKREGMISQSVVHDSLNNINATFQTPVPENPFSNILVTDYEYNVEKLPAPPSTNDNILSQAKQFVRNAHKDQPEIADKLFNDLAEEFTFEQSMRPFYSMPNTTIPNDQQGFRNFCYGDMVSCKEGNPLACARNLLRHVANE